MTANFALRRLAWIGILMVVVLVLGSLLVPMIRKLTFRKASETSKFGDQQEPRSGDSGPIPGMNPASSSQVSGIGLSKHAIIIHVLDALSGRGIEGASLQIRESKSQPGVPPDGGEFMTDKSGTCAVSLPAQITSVMVRADGYVSRYLLFRSTEDFLPEYTFRLEEGIAIGGFVHDPDGKPIRDVRIAVQVDSLLSLSSKPPYRDLFNPMLLLQTDSSGSWKCSEVPRDPERITLSLSHPEFMSGGYTSDAAHAASRKIQSIAMKELESGNAVLIMKYGLLLAGMVMDEDGKAIEGAAVKHVDRSVARRELRAASTSADGRFVFADAAPGETEITIQAKGFVSANKIIAVVRGLPDVEFRLKRGGSVRGRVVDDDGNPIEGVDIMTYLSGVGTLWQCKTDTDGRFLWESAPEKALEYRVYAKNYQALPAVLLETNKDYQITLHRLLTMRISGTVTDSHTKTPIDRFTVAALPDRMPDVAVVSVEGTAGNFTLPVDERFPTYSLRVNADGFVTKTSSSLEFRQGDLYLEFNLSRGDGPSGVVKLPGGEPVADAGVYLCGGIVTNTSFINPGEKAPAAPMMTGLKTIRAGQGGGIYYAATTTDEKGRFTFSSMPEAHTAISSHERGFVAVTVEQLKDSRILILQPWGRIEGSLKIGKSAGANQTVRLRSLNFDFVSRPPEILITSMAARTDNEGGFAFPTLPPGDYWIEGPGGQAASATVRSGETVLVKLGGSGRPLTGTFVISGTDQQPDWSRVRPILAARRPEVPMPDRNDKIAMRAWRRTEEGKNWLRTARNYPITVAADGSFRAEDIPAGTYTLSTSITIADPSQPSQIRRGEATQEVVVQEMTGGGSDTPISLGRILIQIVDRLRSESVEAK